MNVLLPATEEEAAALVREASAARRALTIESGGTKRGLGRPVEAAATLSLKALRGITLLEPAEMAVSARAGTPLAEIEAALAEKGQRLAFEPQDHRALYDSDGEPSIGAVAAINNSGPRRIQAGAARDALLGIRFVNGRGEIIKSGGRVMKNVTGLDLVKLLCGSHGTLGALTEVTFRTLPQPEASATLALSGLDDASAAAALSRALGSPFEVTGAAHLPARDGKPALTLFRLEGFGFSVDYRSGELQKLLADCGSAARLGSAEAALLWRSVRDAAPVIEPRGNAVWRISVKPSDGPRIAAEIKSARAAEHFFDWGGGLIWLSTPAEGDAGAGVIRAAVAKSGGHATLARAPGALRAAVPVFQPEAAAVAAITAKLRASFDPAGIFSPGRMG